ncbi:transposase [Streptomyces sp. NPDC014891]|uniref:transposase n=1 Tax=Streptomyces sp. NPDC014891 TaxID=3364929 RepID=UPI0036F4D2DE
MSLQHHNARRDPLAELGRFRGEFYSCLTDRSDALFELADPVSCGDGPVRSLAELSLVGECRRGHGRLYAALTQGRADADRMRRAPGLAAATSRRRPAGPGRRRHMLATARRHRHRTAAARPGRAAVSAGQWQTGDPNVLVIADAGYDAPRLAFLRRDLPAQMLARVRSDRVQRRPTPLREPHTRGRPPWHGGKVVFEQPDTWGTLDTQTVAGTRLYGTALTRSWERLHPATWSCTTRASRCG